MSSRTHSLVVAGLVLPLLLGIAGCSSPGGDSSSKAETVFLETMALGPAYATYGVTLVSEADDPFSQQVLAEAMTEGTYKTALAALRAVAREPGQEMTPALRDVFDNKKGALRLQAAIALSRQGDSEALEWVRSEIEQGGGMLNIDAAILLAEQGDEDRLIPVLRELMSNDDLSVRNEAYAILGELDRPWATEMLLEGLGNEHGEGRLQAIVSLGHVSDAVAAAEVRRFTGTQGLVFASIEALGELGDADSADHLVALGDHEEPLVRVYVGAALWKLGRGDEAAEILEPLTASEDTTVRQNLAEQLARVEGSGVNGMLIRLAGDSEREVRLAAIRGLKNRPDPAVEQALVTALADRDYEVVSLALSALASSGGEGSLAEIEPHLDDENPYVVLSAASAAIGVRYRTGTAG